MAMNLCSEKFGALALLLLVSFNLLGIQARPTISSKLFTNSEWSFIGRGHGATEGQRYDFDRSLLSLMNMDSETDTDRADPKQASGGIAHPSLSQQSSYLNPSIFERTKGSTPSPGMGHGGGGRHYQNSYLNPSIFERTKGSTPSPGMGHGGGGRHYQSSYLNPSIFERTKGSTPSPGMGHGGGGRYYQSSYLNPSIFERTKGSRPSPGMGHGGGGGYYQNSYLNPSIFDRTKESGPSPGTGHGGGGGGGGH